MNYIQTEIDGVWLIEPKVLRDERGYFMEAFKEEEFKMHIGDVHFIQDNESKSSFGVLRGLHKIATLVKKNFRFDQPYTINFRLYVIHLFQNVFCTFNRQPKLSPYISPISKATDALNRHPFHLWGV